MVASVAMSSFTRKPTLAEAAAYPAVSLRVYEPSPSFVGSSNSRTNKVGHISKDQLRQIAEYKLPDLNCTDIESAMKVIEGSARNMGIVIDD